MQFYKPKQGDTASVVADGYASNFETLDTAKADAQTVADALAGKADKAEGKDLMTSAEREKLAGIEAGANAYTHPESHPADMITDTAGKVVMTAAEREKLSGVEAAANNYVHPTSHPADIIEDTAEKVMMTSAEREKLSGIEAGANAYTLPAATASTLGGVKAGANVTITPDGTLSAGEYVLPKASSTVLGGIKVGNNLSIREDGTLDAAGGGTATVSPDAGNTLEQRANGLFVPPGSGGSGSGGGILVLPHVAPERDADGNLTNSAAFVAAWGGIFSEYLAAPDSHALYYMDTEAGEGLMLRIPCNVMNIGSDADMVQWLISGFTVVNVPMPSSEPVSCKATVMAAVICNAAGEMQSVAMYASEGIAAANGKPNLLGADDAVIVEIPDNATEDQLKTILQPVVTELQIDPARRVIVRYGVMLLPAATGITDVDFMIAAINANPLTVSDPDNKWIVRAQVYCRLSNGVIQSAVGDVTGYELATTEAVKTAINEIPYLGENLLLESRGPWIRHSMGDIKALPLSIGFLTQGETYVFSYVDGCSAPAYPTFHLLTRNGPDIIQQIEPGVPFVATRADWEYILIRKGNEGGICTVSRLKLERGTKVTSWACAPTEAGPLPYSLDEQLVPGEFWDGKQVYVRSFKGQMPNLGGFAILTSGVDTITNIQASVNTHPYNSVPPGFVFTFNNNASYDLLYQIYSADGMIYLSTYGEKMAGVPYTAIIKYTKA